MKLRIRGNSLRLRLTRTEIAELTAKGAVENRCELGAHPELALVYRLELSAAAIKPEIIFQNSQICIRLPVADSVNWAQGDQVGIYADESWGLKLAIEKDFKCLDPRLDEDEPDAFENPHATSHAACALSD